VYAGISSLFTEGSSTRFAIVIRSSSELVNFFECTLPCQDRQEAATEVPILVLDKLIQYRNVFHEKIAGIALPRELSQRCPSLATKLWEVLDAVPLVIEQQKHRRAKGDQGELATFLGWDEKQMDEQADSMVRKCIRFAVRSARGGAVLLIRYIGTLVLDTFRSCAWICMAWLGLIMTSGCIW
jgi:hypothetical protein